MVDFATAEEASIDTFVSVSKGSPYAAQLAEYTQSLLRQGRTRPGWCLVALEGGVPVARAALWGVADVPSDVVLIDADWDEPGLADIRAVLEHAHEAAAALGSRELMHHLDSPPGPPQYQEHATARAGLITEAGYELLRDGLRWRYSGAAGAAEASTLTFRPLGYVGEDAFVEAIAATYEGTRDSWLTTNIEEQGLLGAARSDFEDYKRLEHRPDWWELGYADDGSAAGVIMAAKIPGAAVIGYVGVTPGQRGRGFAAQLVRRGTEQLLAAGEADIRGDCDAGNVPMVKAFERGGYESFARRRSYRCVLAA